MKKKIVAYLVLLFVIANTLFPAFPPTQGGGVQPLNGWEWEWF